LTTIYGHLLKNQSIPHKKVVLRPTSSDHRRPLQCLTSVRLFLGAIDRAHIIFRMLFIVLTEFCGVYICSLHSKQATNRGRKNMNLAVSLQPDHNVSTLPQISRDWWRNSWHAPKKSNRLIYRTPPLHKCIVFSSPRSPPSSRRASGGM
jgi:hypothetical protein